MEAYGFALAYFALHFLLYVLVGRRQSALRTERGIFLFHLLSVGVLLIAAAAYALSSDRSHAVPIVFGVAALHGIYSLSFLELWTLSQISYSRDVIEAVLSGRSTEKEVIAALAEVGDRKKSFRLQGLENLGLLRVSAGMVQLRGGGEVVSAGLRFLRWITNLRSTG